MKAEWTNSDSLTTSQTTKAILVIDKPKDCFTCELGGSKVCIGGCPLKPMPKKQYVEANSIEDVMLTEFDMETMIMKIKLDTDKLFAIGWNACLEELEK